MRDLCAILLLILERFKERRIYLLIINRKIIYKKSNYNNVINKYYLRINYANSIKLNK